MISEVGRTGLQHWLMEAFEAVVARTAVLGQREEARLGELCIPYSRLDASTPEKFSEPRCDCAATNAAQALDESGRRRIGTDRGFQVAPR
jgi:hypothetical protein